MQKNATYIRPKVVGPSPGPYASGSYVHRAALFKRKGKKAIVGLVRLKGSCVPYVPSYIFFPRKTLPFLIFVDSRPLLNVLLSNNDIAKLLVPLLKLRQACRHPQVGSFGLCSLQHNPLSMDEILQVNNSLFYLHKKLVVCE
jgi:hypothetical protein